MKNISHKYVTWPPDFNTYTGWCSKPCLCSDIILAHIEPYVQYLSCNRLLCILFNICWNKYHTIPTTPFRWISDLNKDWTEIVKKNPLKPVKLPFISKNWAFLETTVFWCFKIKIGFLAYWFLAISRYFCKNIVIFCRVVNCLKVAKN